MAQDKEVRLERLRERDTEQLFIYLFNDLAEMNGMLVGVRDEVTRKALRGKIENARSIGEVLEEKSYD